MIVTFVVAKGEDEAKLSRLLDGETKTLGRSSRCDIILRDAGVSRRHCSVRLNDGVCYVSDLGSRNGTAVNGAKIHQESVLNNNDSLEIGTSRISVRITSTTQRSSDTSLRSTSSPITGLPVPARQTGQTPPPDKPRKYETPPKVEAAILDLNLESSPEPAPKDPSGFEPVMGTFEKWLDNPPPESSEQKTEAELAPVSLQPPEDRPSPLPDDLIGTVVGACRVEKLIGEDDISRIYRATQVSMERVVALKILLPGMTHDSTAVERFIHGARAGGKLIHPNIVHVYDAGQDNQVYFIALELVDGKSVRQLLLEKGRSHPLDLTLALEIGRQIAGALDYAHEQSIIHRSITPDNILVTPHRVAKLADLGFAKNLADAGIQRHTRPGERLGELLFAPPEQLADARSADAKSDIYSLGAVLFVMLTGHVPFLGKTELEIMDRVRKGEHQPIRRLNRNLPAELGQIIHRAMDPNPARRQSRAAELQDQLREALDQMHP